MGLRITGVQFNQQDHQLIIGYAKAGDILKQSRIDEWSPDNPNGYQREVNERRAREFGNFMAQKGLSPSAVLLNLRDADFNEIRQVSESVYEIPDRISLWIVDGQHRLKGLEYAGIKYPDLLEISIPVVLLNLQSYSPELARKQEATQFLIINKTQKGVRSDLAERILAQAEEKNEEIDYSINKIPLPENGFVRVEEYRMNDYLLPVTFPRKSSLSPSDREKIEHKESLQYPKDALAADREDHQATTGAYPGQDILPSNLKRELRWKPRAVRISDLMNCRPDSPLKGRMKLPNIRPRGTTFSQVSLVSSLKNVLSTAPFSHLTDDELSSVLINLWKAVEGFCPEPFREVEAKQRAEDYVLLKTTGIFVLPRLLLGLDPYLPRENGMAVYTVEVFRQFLSRAGGLMASSFWRSAGAGTAGAYGTGQKSFSQISGMIMKRILMRGDDQGKQKVIL